MISSDIYILWVRHCISCSNVAEEKDVEQRYRKEPLCTSEGIVHAVVSGDQIAKYVQKTFPGRKVEVFSSFLPRAMETAKLISSEMIDHGLIDPLEENEMIRRLPFISELWSNYEIKVAGGVSSTSTTTRERSDTHANFLNAFLPNVGLPIDTNDKQHLLEIEQECSILKTKRRCKLDMKDSYKKFLSHFILGGGGEGKGSHIFSKDKVNIVVSHGAFIEKYIIIPTTPNSFIVDNVDSALVSYSVSDDEKEGDEVEQKLLHYLKSPSTTSSLTRAIARDRRLTLKLNSYEMKKILETKFANCNYTYDDILRIFKVKI